MTTDHEATATAEELRAELDVTQRKLQFLVEVLDASDARLTLPDGTRGVSVTEVLKMV